jgi:hypothetical protein
MVADATQGRGIAFPQRLQSMSAFDRCVDLVEALASHYVLFNVPFMPFG